jgi:hypothetical protein
MECLIGKGLLRMRMDANEWLLPDGHDLPTPPLGYVVSFAYFHERGLTSPHIDFSWGYSIITRSSYST